MGSEFAAFLEKFLDTDSELLWELREEAHELLHEYEQRGLDNDP